MIAIVDIRQLREKQQLLSQQLEEKQLTERHLTAAIDEQDGEAEQISETRHRVSIFKFSVCRRKTTYF